MCFFNKDFLLRLHNTYVFVRLGRTPTCTDVCQQKCFSCVTCLHRVRQRQRHPTRCGVSGRLLGGCIMSPPVSSPLCGSLQAVGTDDRLLLFFLLSIREQEACGKNNKTIWKCVHLTFERRRGASSWCMTSRLTLQLCANRKPTFTCGQNLITFTSDLPFWHLHMLFSCISLWGLKLIWF